MMMVRNVTNSRNLYEKGRVGIMVFLIMVTSMFFGLMSAASEAYAQEASQKARQRAEPVAQRQAGNEAYEKLLLEAESAPAEPLARTVTPGLATPS